MRILKALLLPLVLITTGCATHLIETDTTAFFVDSYAPTDSISVVSGDAKINNSLEFAAYKRKFENKLASVGYRIAPDPSKSDYIALIAYGIDGGETAVVSTPIFGQTSGGTTSWSGTVYGAGGSTTYSGTNYTMPTYGLVGSATESVSVYNRAIALDIVDTKSLKEGSPKKVYEGRTRSKGSCAVIVEVFDEMLNAMFSDFPGLNGRNRKQAIRGEFNC